jgi:hypothetical protein
MAKMERMVRVEPIPIRFSRHEKRTMSQTELTGVRV